MLQKEIPMAINVLAAKYAKSKNKTVMLDCGGTDEEISAELMNNLDFISPNTTELLRIDPTIDSDKDNVVESIREKLIKKYPNLTFILKMGSKGSRVITDKLNVYVNAITKINPSVLDHYKIIDAVGAGYPSHLFR
jgi:sugar/nucleoside kinase (ribokinase family)